MKNKNEVLLISTVAIIFFLFSSSSSCQTNEIKKIVGKEWKIVFIDGKELKAADLENGYPRMTFNEDYKLSGFTGCNTFNGSFKIKDSTISLDPGVMTKMMCDNNTEMRILTAFKNITEWKYSGNKLELLTKEKTILILVSKSE